MSLAMFQVARFVNKAIEISHEILEGKHFRVNLEINSKIPATHTSDTSVSRDKMIHELDEYHILFTNYFLL